MFGLLLFTCRRKQTHASVKFDMEFSDMEVLVDILPDEITELMTMDFDLVDQVNDSRDRRVSAEDVDCFIDQQKKENTKKATAKDVRNVHRWLRENCDESRPMNEIEPDILDKYLSRFFISVRKADGSEYEPSTLVAMKYSFDILKFAVTCTSAHKYGLNILRVSVHDFKRTSNRSIALSAYS